MPTAYTYTISLPRSIPKPPAGCVNAASGNITPYPPVNSTTTVRQFNIGDTLKFKLPTNKVKTAWMHYTCRGAASSPFSDASPVPITKDTQLTFQATPSGNCTIQIWFDVTDLSGNHWMIPDPEVQVGTGS